MSLRLTDTAAVFQTSRQLDDDLSSIPAHRTVSSRLSPQLFPHLYSSRAFPGPWHPRSVPLGLKRRVATRSVLCRRMLPRGVRRSQLAPPTEEGSLPEVSASSEMAYQRISTSALPVARRCSEGSTSRDQTWEGTNEQWGYSYA